MKREKEREIERESERERERAREREREPEVKTGRGGKPRGWAGAYAHTWRYGCP